jgi:hypothetical protein
MFSGSTSASADPRATIVDSGSDLHRSTLWSAPPAARRRVLEDYLYSPVSSARGSVETALAARLKEQLSAAAALSATGQDHA